LADLKQSADGADASGQRAAPKAMTLRDAERDHVLGALAEANWVIGGAKKGGDYNAVLFTAVP
jgi:hypothetical protein